jgi:hypothetical protein
MTHSKNRGSKYEKGWLGEHCYIEEKVCLLMRCDRRYLISVSLWGPNQGYVRVVESWKVCQERFHSFVGIIWLVRSYSLPVLVPVRTVSPSLRIKHYFCSLFWIGLVTIPIKQETLLGLGLWPADVDEHLPAWTANVLLYALRQVTFFRITRHHVGVDVLFCLINLQSVDLSDTQTALHSSESET